MLFTLQNLYKKKKINSMLKNPNLPESIQRYLLTNQKIFSKKIEGRSNNLRYIVFDTETTGLDEKRDKILSIGAVAVNGNSIHVDDSFYQIVQHYQEKLEKTAIQVHGIFPEQSLSGEKLDVVMCGFLDYLQDSIIVAHHADFDIKIINRFLYSLYKVKLLNPIIDTAILMKRIYSIMNSYEYEPMGFNLNLDALAERFKISTEGRHNALADAYITAELFLKLTTKLIRLGKKYWTDWII
jgi:DNA polymerase-3 subunit epsilon